MSEHQYVPVNMIAVRCPRCRYQFTVSADDDEFTTYCGNSACYAILAVKKKGRKGNKWKVRVSD